MKQHNNWGKYLELWFICCSQEGKDGPLDFESEGFCKQNYFFPPTFEKKKKKSHMYFV